MIVDIRVGSPSYVGDKCALFSIHLGFRLLSCLWIILCMVFTAISPPCLSNSAASSSAPRALLFLRLLIASWTLSRLGSSGYHVFITVVCNFVLIFIFVNVLFSYEGTKYSAYLSNISSLCLISPRPYFCVGLSSTCINFLLYLVEGRAYVLNLQTCMFLVLPWLCFPSGSSLFCGFFFRFFSVLATSLLCFSFSVVA